MTLWVIRGLVCHWLRYCLVASSPNHYQNPSLSAENWTPGKILVKFVWIYDFISLQKLHGKISCAKWWSFLCVNDFKCVVQMVNKNWVFILSSLENCTDMGLYGTAQQNHKASSIYAHTPHITWLRYLSSQLHKTSYLAIDIYGAFIRQWPSLLLLFARLSHACCMLCMSHQNISKIWCYLFDCDFGMWQINSTSSFQTASIYHICCQIAASNTNSLPVVVALKTCILYTQCRTNCTLLSNTFHRYLSSSNRHAEWWCSTHTRSLHQT